MNRIHRTAVAALALALFAPAGCGSAADQPPPLADARIGGPFTLTDQDGRTVRDTDFAGKYRIVYFGYTYCPDVCPTDMLKLGKAMEAFDRTDPARSAKVVPIFISVDPERDDPKALKQFVANFHPRFIGLTGTPEDIARTAKAYAVYFKKQPPAQPGGAYLVDHLAVAFLMDPQGKPMVALPIDKDGPVIAAELRRWVR